jgi:dGTP triphosphohydrolase
MNLFGSRVNKDPIDIWVLKAANNNLGVSDIKKDSDKFYLVDNPDGTSRPMTDEETYDVSAEAARIFNGLLVDYYNKEKNNPITKTSQEQVAKDLSERHNEAKKASFRKLFKGSKNEDKYLEDKFDWLKKDEGKETEIKRAADDIANKVSEETKALRDRLPKDKYDKQIFLAKMLRSIVNKTTTLKQWKEAGIIESVEKEGQEILKLSK